MEFTFKDKVTRVVSRVKIAYLATCSSDQPVIRPVQPMWEETDLWIATRPATAKVRQIKSNPRVQLFYQVDEKYDHLVVTGLAEMVDDLEEKRRLWNHFSFNLGDYYKGLDDPNFGLMKVKATRIELASMSGGIRQPQVWKAE